MNGIVSEGILLTNICSDDLYNICNWFIPEIYTWIYNKFALWESLMLSLRLLFVPFHETLQFSLAKCAKQRWECERLKSFYWLNVLGKAYFSQVLRVHALRRKNIQMKRYANRERKRYFFQRLMEMYKLRSSKQIHWQIMTKNLSLPFQWYIRNSCVELYCILKFTQNGTQQNHIDLKTSKVKERQFSPSIA